MSERPRPPENLTEETLLEWHRIVDELADAGRLDRADRAILELYAQTWSLYQEAIKHVREHGAVVTLNNKQICQSPQYKTARESAVMLRKLLNDLGLTAASRAKSKPQPKPAGSATRIEF